MRELILTASAIGLIAVPQTAIARSPDSVRIVWVGGPTMQLRFGPIEILTDPVLGEGPEAFTVYDPNSGKPDIPQARLTPLPGVKVDGIDLVLVSHTHEDHLDRTAVAKLGAHAEFIAPTSQVGDARKRGLVHVDGIGVGESRTISEQGYQLTITAIAARHSPRPELLPVLGEVNGYWLDFRHGRFRRTIYWTGDSFAPANGVPKELQAPDLFIPHLGGVGEGGPIGPVSMTSNYALSFALQVRPKAILPIHHSTFSLYREPIERFDDEAARAGLTVERLVEGEQFLLK